MGVSSKDNKPRLLNLPLKIFMWLSILTCWKFAGEALLGMLLAPRNVNRMAEDIYNDINYGIFILIYLVTPVILWAAHWLLKRLQEDGVRIWLLQIAFVLFCIGTPFIAQKIVARNKSTQLEQKSQTKIFGDIYTDRLRHTIYKKSTGEVLTQCWKYNYLPHKDLLIVKQSVVFAREKPPYPTDWAVYIISRDTWVFSLTEKYIQQEFGLDSADTDQNMKQ